MYIITPRIDGTAIEDSRTVADALATLYDREKVTLALDSARQDAAGHLCRTCGAEVKSTAGPAWHHVEPAYPRLPHLCAAALDALACATCGEYIEPTDTGWRHLVDDDEHEHQAEPEEDDDLAARALDNHAEPSPLDWLNSAAVELDPEGDAVHLYVSTGEPRGAHRFTVRRIQPDDGPPALILHTPYPGEPSPHTGLLPMHPGTYREASYPAGADLVPAWITRDERDTIVRALDHAGPPAADIAAKLRRL